MPITNLHKDLDALTMTVTAEFPVSVERLWAAYADARTLERFWGPPGYPATFPRHELVPGGRCEYYMTGPDGERFHGYWDVLAVQPGASFRVRDGFAHADGSPNGDAPTMEMTMTFEPTATGSRFESITRFASLEDLEQLVELGMEEGARLSMAQIDHVLTDLRTHAATVTPEVLSDTTVRFARFFDHPRGLLWEAHTTPTLLRRWMLGPADWTMSVCEIDLAVGGAIRYRWERDGADPIEITGRTQFVEPGSRWVTTESMSDMDGPATTNDLSLTEVDGGTLLTLLITYPDAETRDAHLATGMTDGMEASYARLGSLLAG